VVFGVQNCDAAAFSWKGPRLRVNLRCTRHQFLEPLVRDPGCFIFTRDHTTSWRMRLPSSWTPRSKGRGVKAPAQQQPTSLAGVLRAEVLQRLQVQRFQQVPWPLRPSANSVRARVGILIQHKMAGVPQLSLRPFHQQSGPTLDLFKPAWSYWGNQSL